MLMYQPFNLIPPRFSTLKPKESMINDAVAIVVFEIMNSAEVAQNGKRSMSQRTLF